jgi:hypothetical protein
MLVSHLLMLHVELVALNTEHMSTLIAGAVVIVIIIIDLTLTTVKPPCSALDTSYHS